jgi:anaerobic selenocysteine-containing dehydrogenase
MEALAALDFLAVTTHMMTPTAELADMVLPKTTGIEEEEVSLDPGAPCVSFTRAVMAPRGEARSDFDIAIDFADRLEARGIEARKFLPWPDKRAFNAFMLGDNDIDFETLERTGFAAFDYALGDFENAGFKTQTGKIELFSERLDALGLDPLPDHVAPRTERETAEIRDRYPLILLTGAREKTYHHSRYRDQAWARKISPFPLVEIHPDTVAASGLAKDDWVRIETPGTDGGCELKVAPTTDVAPGILRTGMGWWLPEAPGPARGALSVNVNAVMSYGGPWDPITGSADTRGLPCRVTRIDREEAVMEQLATEAT